MVAGFDNDLVTRLQPIGAGGLPYFAVNMHTARIAGPFDDARGHTRHNFGAGGHAHFARFLDVIKTDQNDSKTDKANADQRGHIDLHAKENVLIADHDEGGDKRRNAADAQKAKGGHERLKRHKGEADNKQDKNGHFYGHATT